MLRERLEQVEGRIHRAVARAGRRRSDVTLVAVTKKFPAEVICDAHAHGLRCFGENYVQEFETKRPLVAQLEGAEFHLIGHLQSNKARAAGGLFQTIETVDSQKLAQRLNEAAQSLNMVIEVMIEVKLSVEETKAGAAQEHLGELIAAIRDCRNLTLTGLMTMPPWNDDPERTRPYFRRLAELARQHELAKLSMGMSHDFEAAIEEGATHIRVGQALFGPRPNADRE
ncbi:MAG TPA: YggS family pyridoxal phosphate-dependent enzyme [Bryobacteraceae bacterium]|nr:YggS family pyridoxal phosphate-dependent enzyme [Bryobacteraceae bacterium]